MEDERGGSREGEMGKRGLKKREGRQSREKGRK